MYVLGYTLRDLIINYTSTFVTEMFSKLTQKSWNHFGQRHSAEPKHLINKCSSNGWISPISKPEKSKSDGWSWCGGVPENEKRLSVVVKKKSWIEK